MVSQLNIAQNITLPHLACLPTVQCILVILLSRLSYAHTSGHPHDVKEITIHQTRPHSSTALWFSSDAYRPMEGAFGGGHVSHLPCLWLRSPIRNKMWWTLCPDTFLWKPALKSPAIWSTVDLLFFTTLSLVHQFSFLRALLVGPDHYIPGTSHKNCSQPVM